MSAKDWFQRVIGAIKRLWSFARRDKRHQGEHYAPATLAQLVAETASGNAMKGFDGYVIPNHFAVFVNEADWDYYYRSTREPEIRNLRQAVLDLVSDKGEDGYRLGGNGQLYLTLEDDPGLEEGGRVEVDFWSDADFARVPRVRDAGITTVCNPRVPTLPKRPARAGGNVLGGEPTVYVPHASPARVSENDPAEKATVPLATQSMRAKGLSGDDARRDGGAGSSPEGADVPVEHDTPAPLAKAWVESADGTQQRVFDGCTIGVVRRPGDRKPDVQLTLDPAPGEGDKDPLGTRYMSQLQCRLEMGPDGWHLVNLGRWGTTVTYRADSGEGGPRSASIGPDDTTPLALSEGARVSVKVSPTYAFTFHDGETVGPE